MKPIWIDGQGYPGLVDVRRLLNRIPDEVVLAASTREFVMDMPSYCLCGWTVREELARTLGRDAESGWISCAHWKAAELFGGTEAEWAAVYLGVCDRVNLKRIEAAWVDRVDRAVRRTSNPQRRRRR